MATPIGSQPPSSSPDEYFNQFEVKIKNHFDNLAELFYQRRSELLQQISTLKAAFYEAEILRNQNIKDLQAMKDGIIKPDIKSNDMVSMMEHMLKTMDDRMQPLKVPTPLPSIEFLDELDIFKDSLNRCELITMNLDWRSKKTPLVAVKQENTKLPHTLSTCANTIDNATNEKSTDITTVQKAATDKDTKLGALAYNERYKLIYAYDTANNVFKVFDMNGKLTSEFGIEECTDIDCLAFNKVCSYLYAVNSKSDDNPITVYQIYVNDYTVLNKSNNEMNYITCVDTDSIGDVYVGGGYVLYMFSAELVIKKELIFPCMGFISIKCLPDSIIVLSLFPYQLSSYSYTGELQKVICTVNVSVFFEIQKKGNYNGNSPPLIAMDSGGLLIYPDVYSHVVLIISPNGNLIHKIGSKGEQEGQFLYPTGVAVTENGLLIVTSNNSKYPLQIF